MPLFKMNDMTPETTKPDNFIGYEDIFRYVSDILAPFINDSESANWGIRKPAGILLYGIPGSGKIFWAKMIANILSYELQELRKFSIFSSDGTNNFGFLVENLLEKQRKTVLFIENFDEIISEKTNEADQFVETTISLIPKFPDNGILLLAGCETISKLDEALLAPGRLDAQIPIFPPNAEERAEMILHFILQDLGESSTLYKILLKNNANSVNFWKEIADKMRCFSNTMIEDFVQSLKKKIRKAYSENVNFTLTSDILDASFRDASTKLTGEYLDKIDQFLIDVSLNNFDDFPERVTALQMELDSYKIPQKPSQSIGFQHNTPEN